MNLPLTVSPQHKLNSQLPVVWAVLERPPLLHQPDGFAPRWYYFLSALGQHSNVEGVVAHRSESRWSPQDVYGALDSPIEQLHCEPVERGIQYPRHRGHSFVLLRHHLLDSLPFLSEPRQWPALRKLWGERPPDLGVFFLPRLAHFAFQLPSDVPCVCVLEEGIERLDHWTIGKLPRFFAKWTNLNEQQRIRRFYRRLARRTAQFVVISDEEKDYFSAAIPTGQITVIPHGIDCEHFAPQNESTDAPAIDVAIFGRMDMLYNTEPAVALYRHAQAKLQEHHNLRWAFVGYDPALAIQELQSENVLVTGSVPDLRPYYERAKVVVVPTQAGTGVKTTVLQAWAMGRPVVATPFALKGLPAEHRKNVLVGHTPEELMGHVNDLLADPTRRAAIAQAGLATVRAERDIRVLAQRFAAICSDALNAAPRSP